MTDQLGTGTGCRHCRRFTSMCASARFYRHMRRSGSTQQIGQWWTAEHVARIAAEDVVRWCWCFLAGHARRAQRHADIRLASDALRHTRSMTEIECQRERRT